MPKIHSIETLGALDGPGIRTVIFFQGCPMRCAYCHNADTFDFAAGEEKSVGELVKFCVRYKEYYGRDGGVTLSGGEPLMQGAAALELTEALQRAGIHVALDTSGAVFAPDVLAAADLTILDIKHTDADAFLRLTGHPIDSTLKTLEFLQKNNKRFWVRQVIVKDITDDPPQIVALKRLSAGAEKIELLPYHTMGAGKWEKCGLTYPLKGVPATEENVMESLNLLLK